jgi:hypothetical protein
VLLKFEPNLVPTSTTVCETAFVTLFSPRDGPCQLSCSHGSLRWLSYVLLGRLSYFNKIVKD